ncbi:putative uncharacterized protein DDB_G0282499 isoform X1 [Vespa crabro]|uniref:putative uncharacterized protein DDB_G0282499 isoform X1 n=2 Tax=Vespa crabro TaxID=7445 RepID=UPI001F01D9EB|nr:putative uncharacterized protein DDB_G0282499 isoform X1 [Vespa crabro]XP_046816987.1 putative uncharacterized protein DDB_G0282499 isoform X1 [Vespa crabro]XP_046816988.1 putative uncharacterized protein DDB_G0282499 isoform X1 [Vespa crabro]XP_046816989.1 putative uncharacterized protein DDB_G0282499 isoform X1 [Vespa crabro]
MEMKFAKFKKDERCKRLERSLKLSLLRKNGKLTNDDPIWNDTDAQNWSFTALSPQLSQAEHEIVPSNKNLSKIKAMKKNNYTTYEPVIASSNVHQSPSQNNSFNNNVASSLTVKEFLHQIKDNSKIIQRDSLLTNENSPHVVEKGLYVQPKNIKHEKNLSKLQKQNSMSNNDNNYNPCKIASPKEKSGRTFFNWKVMLNKDGHLIIKGTLESGQTARSKPILRRLTATSVQSTFLHIYYLEGNIVDNENELPEYVRGKFYNGFPDDWENIYLLWKVFISEGSKLSFHWPTKITDSDDDLNSEVTNLTLQFTKEDKNKYQKSSSNICNNNSDNTSRIKTDNNVSNHVPNTKVQIPNTTRIIHDNKILNKENQEQHKNVNQPQCIQKKHTLKDIIQEDKINIIINNLLHKDCPKEYIVKIVQMFNCLEDVLSYRVATNDANKLKCDDNDSGLYSSQLQGNETVIRSKRSCMPEYHNISPITKRIDQNNYSIENVHEISNMILQEQSQNDIQELNKRDSEEFESEIYAGMPKIIFQKVLENKRASLKQDKQKQRKGIIDSIPMTKSHIKSQKRVKKKHRTIHYSNSSDSDIENDIKNSVSDERKKRNDKAIRHNALEQQKNIKKPETISFTQGSVSYKENLYNVYHDCSVSIIEDEEPSRRYESMIRVNDMNRIETPNRGKKSTFKYNCNRDISTTDDEVELPGTNYKKHLNTIEVIKHSAKKPKIINRH